MLVPEFAFATCLELLGNVFGAIIVGNILSIIAGMDETSEKQRQRAEGVKTLMIKFPLPGVLRRRLRKWVVRCSGQAMMTITIRAARGLGGDSSEKAQELEEEEEK